VSQAVSEILDLSYEVGNRQSRDPGILRTPFAIWQVARAAASSHVAEPNGPVRDHVGHRRMVAWEPIDYILAVADVHERKGRIASVKTARLRLLGRVLVRSEVSAWRGLGKRFFTGLRRLFEAVRPQRLMFEGDRRNFDASFFVAGRFGSRRFCLSRLRKGRASKVVGPLDGRAERETGNSYDDRFDVGIHAVRINDSGRLPPPPACPALPALFFTQASCSGTST
jgi:hypothetical protein